MAVERTIKNLKLQVTVEDGTTSSGAKKEKNLNFNKIKLIATDEELYEAGKALAESQTLPLSGIKIIPTTELTEDG